MLPAIHTQTPRLVVRQSGLSHNVLAFHMWSALHSLASNSICLLSFEGLNALIDAMKQMPQLTSLK